MEDVEFRFAVGVQEALGDVVEAVLEEGYGFPAVVEYPDFPDEPVSGDSGQISPEEGYGDDGDLLHRVGVAFLGRQPAEADGLHLAQGGDHHRHEANPRLVDSFAEMAVQHVEQITIFAACLGISSYGKHRKFSSKLQISKILCKFFKQKNMDFFSLFFSA